jgi:hypothetical protein
MMEFSQVVASVSVLLGVFLYGQKSITGPIISICACLGWAVIALYAGMLPLCGLNLILACVHFYNLCKWSGEQ